jgi:hypothetical protein
MIMQRPLPALLAAAQLGSRDACCRPALGVAKRWAMPFLRLLLLLLLPPPPPPPLLLLRRRFERCGCDGCRGISPAVCATPRLSRFTTNVAAKERRNVVGGVRGIYAGRMRVIRTSATAMTIIAYQPIRFRNVEDKASTDGLMLDIFADSMKLFREVIQPFVPGNTFKESAVKSLMEQARSVYNSDWLDRRQVCPSTRRSVVLLMIDMNR